MWRSRIRAARRYAGRCVGWPIGEQRGGHQYRHRQAQKSDQLIKPLISGWCQKTHEISSAFWGRLSATGGLALSTACLEEPQKHPNHTKRPRENLRVLGLFPPSCTTGSFVRFLRVATKVSFRVNMI